MPHRPKPLNRIDDAIRAAHRIGPVWADVGRALYAEPLEKPAFIYSPRGVKDGLVEEVAAMRPGDVLPWRAAPEERRNIRARVYAAAANAGFRVVVSSRVAPGMLHIVRVQE